jgi:hypothetical protein
MQFLNAFSPISVTELGIIIEVIFLQPAKVQEPILVTELGIAIKPVKPVRVWDATNVPSQSHSR